MEFGREKRCPGDAVLVGRRAAPAQHEMQPAFGARIVAGLLHQVQGARRSGEEHLAGRRRTHGSCVPLDALNHYETGGRRVTVRAVAFTDRDASGRVTSIRVHQGLSPLDKAAA